MVIYYHKYLDILLLLLLLYFSDKYALMGEETLGGQMEDFDWRVWVCIYVCMYGGNL